MANCPEDGDIMEGFGERDDTSIMRVGALCLEVIGELERLNAAALIVGPCDLMPAMFLHPLVPSALRECALDQLPLTSV